MLIAQIPTPTPAQFSDWTLGLFGALGVAALILHIVRHFRRHPPIEAEFATKAELARAIHEIERMQATIAGLLPRQEFSAFAQQVTSELKSLSASITANQLRVIEQIQDMGTQMRVDSERRASKTHERIDALAATVSALNERTRGVNPS